MICGGIREGRFRALKWVLSLLWPNDKLIYWDFSRIDKWKRGNGGGKEREWERKKVLERAEEVCVFIVQAALVSALFSLLHFSLLHLHLHFVYLLLTMLPEEYPLWRSPAAPSSLLQYSLGYNIFRHFHLLVPYKSSLVYSCFFF